MLGLGAFTREKNVRFAIEALALLPAPRPGLHWVGNIAEPGLVEEMQALAAQRVAWRSRHICGWPTRSWWTC